MTIAFGFTALLRTTEDRLVAGLDLVPLRLPAELTSRQGIWRGAPVELAARAYHSPVIAYARFVTVSGLELEIGNALCLSTPDRPLPIFGADLVGFAADRGVVVADLSPVVPAGALREQQLAVLTAARRGRPELASAGELPAWCLPWFSPQMLFARPAPHQTADVARCFDAFPSAFLAIASATAADEGQAAEVSSVQRAYCAAHRDEDKGLGMLAKLFDGDFSRRFIDEILFPSTIPIRG